MKYNNFGRTGIQVSPLCLGCMNFGGATDESSAQQLIDRSIDEGINFIDTANAYNEGKSEQPPYNLLDRRIERELVPMAMTYNIALIN